MFKSKINLQLEIISLQVQSSELHENYFVNFNQSKRETKFVYFVSDSWKFARINFFSWTSLLNKVFFKYYAIFFMKKKTKEIISIKHLFLSGYACNVPVYTLHQYLIYIFLEGSFTYQGDKVYQLLAHGRWFSPASSTTKTDRHYYHEWTII
jgi:hypothetical protein